MPRRVLSTWAGIAWLCAAAAAGAQAYPAKPVRLILPAGPGSTTDTIGRLYARHLSQGLGQQVIVDNQPGAGGNLAVPIAARAAPDGHTLLMVISAQAISPHLYSKLTYDLLRDFAAVSQIADGTYMLTVHPSLPVRTVKALVALARARPGELTYASGGVGTGIQLTSELFKIAAKIDMLHVPYRGMGAAIGELVGGQISMGFLGLPSGLPQTRTGKLRALAVTSAARSSAVRELPTMAESGLPGFEATTWQGLMAPAATPREIITRLHAETVRVVQTADVRERFAGLGVEPVSNTPAQFGAYLQAEIVKWGQVVRNAGLEKQ